MSLNPIHHARGFQFPLTFTLSQKTVESIKKVVFCAGIAFLLIGIIIAIIGGVKDTSKTRNTGFITCAIGFAFAIIASASDHTCIRSRVEDAPRPPVVSVSIQHA